MFKYQFIGGNFTATCTDCNKSETFNKVDNNTKYNFETAHKQCRAKIKSRLRKHIERLNK